MNAARVRAAASRRSVRVLLLTALLTTVACECNDDDPLSSCLSEILHAPCYVANADVPTDNCVYHIQVIPPESDCASCSTCPHLADGYVYPDLLHGGGCASNCRISCPPGDVVCDPAPPSRLESDRGLSDGSSRR